MNSSTQDSTRDTTPDPAADPSSGPTVEALLELGSATLGESGARLASPRLRAAWPGARVAGPVLPVRCTPGDNLAVHVAVASAQPGSVLAVDVGDVAERGYWGEVLTVAALARRIAGLVIDGGVRDVEALCRHGFPVFSATIALRGATKRGPGSVGRPVRVGGALAEAGDWLVADADGVVVLPGSRLREVLVAGRARSEKEQEYFRVLAGGTTTVELLGLDAAPVSVE